MQDSPDNQPSPVSPDTEGRLRKQRIIDQVDAETQRRTRLLKVYAALMIAGLGLGGVTLLLAKPATSTEYVTLNNDQLTPVMNVIGDKANTAADKAQERVTATGDEAEKRVLESAKAASAEIPTLAATAVDEQVKPEMAKVQSKLIQTQAIANKFSGFDFGRIDRGIEAADQLFKSFETIQGLKEQQDEWKPQIAAVKGFPAREQVLANTLNNLQATVDTLQTKVRDLQKEVDSLKERPASPVTGGRRLSYAVKENSTAQIYDLNLKIKLGSQKKEIIDQVEISSTLSRPINGQKTFTVTNLEMGQSITFADAIYSYVLTPIYIQRRALKKDFLGFAIQREPVLINPNLNKPQPSPTP
jgi:ribosomal protein S6